LREMATIINARPRLVSYWTHVARSNLNGYRKYQKLKFVLKCKRWESNDYESYHSQNTAMNSGQ